MHRQSSQNFSAPSIPRQGRPGTQSLVSFLLRMADRPEVQNVSGDGVVLFGKYELGRLLGCGAFAKVYYARDVQSGTSVAIKVISKQKIVREGLVPHIKREIAIMRRLRHPHIVRLFEVLATKAKIYFVMEYVKGGELFAKISTKGKLREDDARRCFQHLISAVRFCHSRGVFHRDLKPENLLLDEHGNVKVSDFGLSAVSEQIRNDGLFHTLCGTPAYVAPEILAKKGYDGQKVDIWSCGVILFVIVAGYLPFNDPNLMQMYKKIYKGQFRCPKFMSPELKRLVQRLLDPNRETRITTEDIIKDAWFCKGGYKDAEFHIDDDDDGWWMKNDLSYCSSELSTNSDEKSSMALITQPPPASLNAFDIISFSSGIDLSGLFDDGKAYAPSQERFISREPASSIIEKLEELAKTVKFTVKKKNTKIHLEGPKFELAVGAEIFHLTDSLVVVEVKKRGGDRAAYEDFYRTKLRPALRKLVCNDSLHAAVTGGAA